MEGKDTILNLKAAFDIRVETLAANLLSDEKEVFGVIDPEDVYIAPAGPIRRRIDHDVKSIRWRHFDEDPVLLIEVNRHGMFDNLPERLLIDPGKDSETAVKRTRSINRQIAEARKFFLPFELSLFTARVEIEQLEQRLVEEFPEFMDELWGLDQFKDCLSPSQTFLLNYLIPEAHRTVGDWELTKLIFESVMKRNVTLQVHAPQTLPIPPSLSDTRDWSLGAPLVLGEAFQDDVPTLTIRIHEVAHEEMEDFMEGGRQHRVLTEILCSYFLPLDTPVELDIQVTEDSYGVGLGETYMGYNFELA